MSSMVFDYGSSFWITRLLFQKGLAITYLLAFLVAANQYKGLIGENGILPVKNFVDQIPFNASPSIFHYTPTNTAMSAAAWSGVTLSVLALLGITEMYGTFASMLSWFLLWALYLSFVNVGQIFWGYGWESMLLETGFLAIFLGASHTAAPVLVIFLLRWVQFRNMFGAGLIKLRGDQCWRDLTCMEHHYETQPLPNPLSWLFHHAPKWFHKLETLGNHIIELLVPFLYFAPQPFAAIAGAATIIFQAWLMLSGNFSWLNWLTIVLSIPLLPDQWLQHLTWFTPPPADPVSNLHWYTVLGLTVFVLYLSYHPVKNLLSKRQAMNASFNQWHLVNTYGAFGSITKTRYELVVQGTQDDDITEETEWKTYRFKGKPTDPGRMPPQVSPYHLRLDWQLWFAAMTNRPRRQWFHNFLDKLLEGEEDVTRLLKENPFPDEPPTHVRVRRYTYEYTDWDDLKHGTWWNRTFVNEYAPPKKKGETPFHQPGSVFFT